MKKIIILVVVSLLLVSCSLPFTINWNSPQSTAGSSLPTDQLVVPPTEAPVVATTQPAIPTLAGTQLNLGGVSMVLPACLAANPTGAIVPAQPYDPNNGPMEYFPQHRAISFPGYPLAGKVFEPVIRVYPVAEFTAMNNVITERVNAMITLINNQPVLPAADIPLLPMFNAAQVFRAQVKFLAFQNGQGIRFLTEYAQFYDPVNNHDLFYTYQGITSDGKYWVSAILPVNAAFLQADYNIPQVPADGIAAPDPGSATFSADMETYMTAMIAKLNSTADNVFTPGLDCLDQYIQSLQIGD